MNASALITCNEVVAGHGRPVVGPLSFSVAEGEVVGLYGPNGAGKSTLLAALTGSARLFGGEIRRRPGLTLTHQRQRLVRPAELPLTGRDLLAVSRADARGLPAPLTPCLDRRLDTLSGGQFQLLHVWACLAGPAALVLLDEPTNNLDPAAVALLATVVRSCAPGRGVVLVSHDGEFLDSVCTRVLRLPAPGTR